MHMTERIPFGKHYTEEQTLITLLQSRGLSITDVNKANHYLTHIGYYRLSAYMYPLLRVPKEQHIYKPGATFSKVMMLYRFDKKLRLLLFNEIEKIEVAVRSAIVKHGCEVTGDPFWMTNPNNFSNPVKFNKTIRLFEDELNHSKERLCKARAEAKFTWIMPSRSQRCIYMKNSSPISRKPTLTLFLQHGCCQRYCRWA